MNCRYHCSACGDHFTSLEAFDAHRSGPHDGDRVCWGDAPGPEQDLRPATEEGVCKMYADARRSVTVYELGTRVDRARAHFARESERTGG